MELIYSIGDEVYEEIAGSDVCKEAKCEATERCINVQARVTWEEPKFTTYVAMYYSIERFTLGALADLKDANDETATKITDGYDGYTQERMIDKKIAAWKKILKDCCEWEGNE